MEKTDVSAGVEDYNRSSSSLDSKNNNNNNNKDVYISEVREFYQHRSILITGATGFIGKVRHIDYI